MFELATLQTTSKHTGTSEVDHCTLRSRKGPPREVQPVPLNQAILAKIDVFCQANWDRGAALSRCRGFIDVDGTVCAIARPWRMQRLWYNSWKRKHALKHQAGGTPDGIIRSAVVGSHAQSSPRRRHVGLDTSRVLRASLFL